MLKLSELSWNINPEPESTTCINNTETLHWTALSVKCIKKWLVTTEHHQTQFQSSEQWFWTLRRKSEDQNHTCSEKTDLGSQFSEPPTEPVKTDTKLYSRPTDPILSSNDVSRYLTLIILFCLTFCMNWLISSIFWGLIVTSICLLYSLSYFSRYPSSSFLASPNFWANCSSVIYLNNKSSLYFIIL